VQTMFVVMINEFADAVSSRRRWNTNIESRHSRRMVPTNRSVSAFARGDRMGVLMVRKLVTKSRDLGTKKI